MPRVLIVDDDHMIRDLLAATLSFGDLQIDEAFDGHEALAVHERSAPDVVILDLDLPGDLSGQDVLERLKAKGTRARFVVLTGSGRAREPQLRAAGAIGYLTKPFSPLALLAEIESALAAT